MIMQSPMKIERPMIVIDILPPDSPLQNQTTANNKAVSTGKSRSSLSFLQIGDQKSGRMSSEWPCRRGRFPSWNMCRRAEGELVARSSKETGAVD
jgi:hypothetical protein